MKIASKKSAPFAFNFWVRKMFGPAGVRGFRLDSYLADMPMWARRMRSRALANIGTTFRVGGTKTYYPTDVIPNSSSNPYVNRYLLVQQAPSGATLSTTLAPSYTISSDDMCQVVPSASFVTPGAKVPLGFMADTPGYSESGVYLGQPPYSGTVFLLCGAGRQTLYGVADSVISAGGLLVPSATTNGYLGPISNVAGIYWCVGAAGSTSDGAGGGIEVYQNLFPLGVDVIT